MTESDEFLRRLDAVEERLAAHAGKAPPGGERLTSPDPGTGERWDCGQVWAHVAEFVPYWIDQAEQVMAAYEGEPVPFGRTKTDAGRIAAIERDRAQPVAVLWSDARADIEALRAFLGRLDGAAWEARGLHPSLGVMGMPRIVDEFMVGHLEQHADQLDEVSG